MNRFSHLKTEDTDSPIEDDRQLRNRKKKLRILEKKPDSPNNLAKVKRILVEIKEYEDRLVSSQKTRRGPPQKINKQMKEDDAFLEQEWKKTLTPEYKAFRQAELDALREKEERAEKARQEKRKRKARAKWEGKQRRQERQGRHERQERIGPLELRAYLIEQGAPLDIVSLAENYDRNVYKKLCLKYHPDKGGSENVFKLLEHTKSHFHPTEFVPDETWNN